MLNLPFMIRIRGHLSGEIFQGHLWRRQFTFIQPRALLFQSFKRSYGREREECTVSLDLKGILRDKILHAENCRNRRVMADLDVIEQLYGEYRQLTTAIQEQRSIRKRMAEQFASAIEMGPLMETLEDSHSVRERIEVLTGQLRIVNERLQRQMMALPNMTSPDAPIGGAELNQVIDTFGPLPRMDSIVDHVELGARLGILDFEGGARTSGSSFYFLKGQGALLESALVQYALSKAIQHGFVPILPPDIVKSKFIRACGFFPRSEENPLILPIYTAEVDGEQEKSSPLKVLAATGEIPLAAYHEDQIFSLADLPKRYVAVSHCFRPETGHHGAGSRGLYRVHQFTKVELFIVKDENLESSEKCLQSIVALQKEILEGLEVNCRVLRMATAELGASAYEKYDIEVYLPGRAGFGEVTSASNCTDYQSRRLAIRYRDGDVKFAHTLNGTAMAVPRIIQAILENHQQPDGTIRIPLALHPFMLDGSTIIEPN